MAYNMYETLRLIQAVEGINPADSFLRNRYFPSNGAADIFNSDKVLAEYKDGDLRLAPVVVPRSGGVTLTRRGTQMAELEPPTIAPKRMLTIDDIKARGFGESLYGDKTPQERAQILITSDLADLDKSCTRREEWMAAEVMRSNGCIMEAMGDDADECDPYEIHFYDDAVGNQAIYTAQDKWSSSAAGIIDDLAAAADMLTSRGLPAEDFVCAPDVANAIVMDETIQKLLDNRRIEIGSVTPKLTSPGAAVVCQLNVYGLILNIISYNRKYTDETGRMKQYIPVGTGIMTAPGAGHTVYGAVTQVEQADGEFHTYANARVPQYISDANANTRSLTMRTRPVCVPYNKDPFIAMKNLL